jgi:hypothetical protein
MANEITVSLRLQNANGALDSYNSGTRTFSVTQNTAAPNRVGGTQAIGTTEEAITVGDLTTEGYALFWNRDATNYVTIGVKPAATYYPCARLKAGETCLLRLEPSVTFYAKADTAAVILQKEILDD